MHFPRNLKFCSAVSKFRNYCKTYNFRSPNYSRMVSAGSESPFSRKHFNTPFTVSLVHQIYCQPTCANRMHVKCWPRCVQPCPIVWDRGIQFPGAKSLFRLNLFTVAHNQYETCLLSPFWHLILYIPGMSYRHCSLIKHVGCRYNVLVGLMVYRNGVTFKESHYTIAKWDFWLCCG